MRVCAFVSTRAAIPLFFFPRLLLHAQAYKECVRVFFVRAQDILRRGLRERELRTFYRDARCQEGALGPALRKLRALTRGEVDEDDEAAGGGDATMALLSELPLPLADLRALLAAQPTAYTLWEVEVVVEDSLRALLGWAIYSFVAAVEVRSCAGACARGGLGRRGQSGRVCCVPCTPRAFVCAGYLRSLLRQGLPTITRVPPLRYPPPCSRSAPAAARRPRAASWW